MKRRIRFLTDGTNVQENRALDLAERFQTAGWTASIAAPDSRPLVERPRVDVLWVLDPEQARRIGDGRFGLLVWEKPARGCQLSSEKKAGALILDNCADVEWRGEHEMALVDRDCYLDLDRQVKRELFEEVADIFGMKYKGTTSSS